MKYISSAGLAVLNKMAHVFRQREGDLRLARLADTIQNVVDLLGFSKVIRVFADLDEAVQSFEE